MLWVLLTLPKGSLDTSCVHVDLSAYLVDRRAMIDKACATRLPTPETVTCFMGDRKVTFPGDLLWHACTPIWLIVM